VLADLPGPKLRAILPAALALEVGKQVTLALRSDAADIHLTEPEALANLQPGQRVLLDDGRLQARVAAVGPDSATLTVEVGGTLLPNKGVNFPDTELMIPAVTERDRAAITTALKVGVDWFALSFVRDADAAAELRRHCDDVPILAKIERPEAVAKSAAIIAAFDGIMVARGDLGVEIALERVPHMQKRLIQQARVAGKPVITATDMLDSMRKNPRPTRAEASDVANAVYDGTDAVMLSGETAVGDYPVEALACMTRILHEAENHQADDGPRQVEVPRGALIDHITNEVVDLARVIGAHAIVTPTLSGRTARLLARHRSRALVVATATDEKVVRRLSLVWGVQAVDMPLPGDGADRLAAAVKAACRAGVLKPGTLVIGLARHPIESGAGFPTIRVARVGPNGESCEP
jgi:pyruvate kinase